MATGIYGSIKASDVKIDNIDIFYTYMADRTSAPGDMLRLTASDVLSYNYLPTDEQVSGQENLLEGLYTLSLNANVFSAVGIYTIYIRPKVIKTTIVDCSNLVNLPSISGIVIDSSSIDSSLISNNALQGYKIEYINADGTKLRDVTRYITSSNKVVPVAQNNGSSAQKSITYRFSDAGSLLFMTLTPSSSSSVKPNAFPFVGNVGQTIMLSNTSFSPVIIEVEMVKNDINSIMPYIAGNQIKNTEMGIVTYYDDNHNIIAQADLYDIKNNVDDSTPLYEVKSKRTQIINEDFDTITGSVS